MVTNFLNFMYQIFSVAFSNYLFILPLGFITLVVCIYLFRKMGGSV